jgi:hypothetical protein
LSAVKDYPEAEVIKKIHLKISLKIILYKFIFKLQRILIEYGKRRLNQNLAKSSTSANSSKINVKTNDTPNASSPNEENLIKIPSIKEPKYTTESEIQDLNRKIKDLTQFDSDIELGLNLINDENRGLTTDMLGLPAIKTPEIFISGINSVDLNKISQKEEILESYLKSYKNIEIDKELIETINEILNLWYK